MKELCTFVELRICVISMHVCKWKLVIEKACYMYIVCVIDIIIHYLRVAWHLSRCNFLAEYQMACSYHKSLSLGV